MKISDFAFWRKKEQPKKEELRYAKDLGALLYGNMGSVDSVSAMKLSAFYCGVDQISNSVAMLPMNIYEKSNGEKRLVDHPLYNVLNLKPNPRWTHFNMWKEVIEHIICTGAAYLYIRRDENLNVKELIPLETQFVLPMLQNDNSVKYSIAGVGTVNSTDVLDLAMHRDLLWNGVSLLKTADNVLNSAAHAEKTADNFFQSGAGLSGILKANQTLTQEQKEQIRSSWNQAFTSDKTRGLAIIPQGLEFQAVSIDPVDAQLLESRKYSVLEIARVLNISPVRLFDMTQVSYNSMEAINLSYLSDTVKPWCDLIADEINLKLFKPSEIGKYSVGFDFSAALQTNRQQLAEYYRTLLTNGILSIDDIRGELGYPKLNNDAGAAHWVQISYANAEDIAAGKYIKQQSQGQNQSVDNKVKSKE